jgi:hypothetical protein
MITLGLYNVHDIKVGWPEGTLFINVDWFVESLAWPGEMDTEGEPVWERGRGVGGEAERGWGTGETETKWERREQAKEMEVKRNEAEVKEMGEKTSRRRRDTWGSFRKVARKRAMTRGRWDCFRLWMLKLSST